MSETTRDTKDRGVSKVKLAVGAASLFLFIIGVKRTFKMDAAAEASKAGEAGGGEPAAPADVPEKGRRRPRRAPR